MDLSLDKPHNEWTIVVNGEPWNRINIVSPIVYSAIYCDLKIKIYAIDSKMFLLVPRWETVEWEYLEMVRCLLTATDNKEEL